MSTPRRTISRVSTAIVFVAATGLLTSGASEAAPATALCRPSPNRPGPPAVAVDPDSSPGIHHPLCLRVTGFDVNGAPLAAGSATPTGYTPSTIKNYLGLTGTGSGQTIAIVAAFDDPNIAGDLAKFDTTFGLPAPPSFSKVTQTGATSGYPATDATWALEIALDVQWAHAVAPAAGILLVEGKSATFTDMDTAIAYAARQTAVTVISNSWGATEFSGESTLDSYCKQTAKLCVFATGDYGNPGTYPAYSPYVLAVGGTTLNVGADGTVASEVSWNGSGGGVSVYEAKPTFQTGTNAKRATPDVSFNADPATGFAVYNTTPYNGQSGWFQMGGTSAGAPQWAGIIAAANQLRKSAGKTVLSGTSTKSLYMANATVYGLTSGLADIATGPTNGSCGAICTPGPGYDFVTGRGSPRKGIDLALKAAP